MDQEKSTPNSRLPFLRTVEDAEALYQKENDPFYLAVFLIQCWLGGLVMRAAGEYAEKKNAKERAFQRGEAWQSFREMFGVTLDKGLHYLLSCLLRFSVADDSRRNSLRHALVPLTIEHRCIGDYFGSKAPGTAKLANEGNDRARRTIVRWCDWLDSEIHLRTHRHWHAAPACFDPDPETRELASLGNAQRHLARLDGRAQACWLVDFVNAAERYKDSPKWGVVGRAMSDDSDRLWTYADVDTLVIALWPLVKAYNWTYRDLLNVIRPALMRASPAAPNSAPRGAHSAFRYPCEREQDFAAYCVNVLGLRKTGKGVSAKNGRPKGYDIATQFCPALAGEAKRTD